MLKRYLGKLDGGPPHTADFSRHEIESGRNDDRFRTLAASSNAAIFIIRGKRFVYVNPTMSMITGFSEGELLSMPFWEVAHPDFQGRVKKRGLLRQIGEMPLSRYEVRLTTKTDEDRWVDFSATALRYQGSAAVLGTIIDITNKKRAERALVRSERQYRLLAENVSEIIWIRDLDSFGLRYISPSVERLRGFSVEEALSLTLAEDLTSASLACSRAAFDLLIRNGQRDKSRVLEQEYHCRDGSTLWTESTLSLMRNDAGRTTGILGVSRDISERKRAEREKESLEVQLLNSQQMEAIGTLAGGIAHDFNNILGTITGFTQLAQMDLPHTHPVLKRLEQVLKASHRAKGLVSQILTLSLRHEQHTEPVRLNHVVEEVLKFLTPSLPSTIEIRKRLAGTGDTVVADAHQLHQMLMNLCTNAFHALEKEGGVLTIALSQTVIDRKGSPLFPELKPGPHAKVTVSDTGCGMPAEVMKRIFDPYFTTKERGKGTGLGLAVVHGIVKKHGAAIHVHSTPDRGTTFEVLFPAIVSDRGQKNREPKQLPIGDETILLVDDEPLLLKAGEALLSMLGYRVRSTGDPAKALALFRKDPAAFDLVITDMTMPRLTGDRLAEELIRIRPDIPIILCTGYSGQISEARTRDIGIRKLAMKPLFLEDLAHIVRDALPPGNRVQPAATGSTFAPYG